MGKTIGFAGRLSDAVVGGLARNGEAMTALLGLAWVGIDHAARSVAEPWADDQGWPWLAVVLGCVGWALLAVVVPRLLATAVRLYPSGKGGWRRDLPAAVACGLVMVAAIVAPLHAVSGIEDWRYALDATDQGEFEAPRIGVLPRDEGYENLGRIGTDSVARFEAVLKGHPGLRRVYLNSMGGLSGDGVRLGRIIRERGLDTVVANLCISACTRVFAGGRERLVPEGKSLGYHSPYSIRWGLKLDTRTEGGSALFRDAGVDEAFIAKAEGTPHEGMWLPDHDEVLKARVATGTVPRRSLPNLWRGPEYNDLAYRKRSLIRESWQAETLSVLDPVGLDKVLAWQVAATEDARSRAAAREIAMDFLNRMAARRIGRADEATVRDAATRMLAAMRLRRGNDDSKCVLVGSRGDLHETGEIVQAGEGEYRPYTGLLASTWRQGWTYDWPDDVPALPDAGDPATWAEPGRPKAGCDDYIAFYQGALGGEGLAPLRRHLMAVVAAGWAEPPGTARAAARP